MHALVASINASCAGLNLQTSCRDLIIVCIASNVNTILQALGRIHRLGQKFVQRIWIITMLNSLDSLLQFQQTDKMVQQMVGEGVIDIEAVEFYTPPDAELQESDPKRWAKTTDLDKEYWRKDAAREARAEEMRRQAGALIKGMLGQRTARLNKDTWGSKTDLRATDAEVASMATPAKVRTTDIQVVTGQVRPLNFQVGLDTIVSAAERTEAAGVGVAVADAS